MSIVASSVLFWTDAQAAIVVHMPTGISGSSEYNPDYAPAKLLDSQSSITESSIDQPAMDVTGSDTSNYGKAWAVSSEGGNGVLVLDMGTSLSLDGLLYSQRTFDNNGIDDFGFVDLWVTNTDPGTAALSLPGSLGVAQATLTLIGNDVGTLRKYDFGATLTGQYVVLGFRAGEIYSGGQELRMFTAVPEPTGGLLAVMSFLALASKRRRSNS